ncbi:hypothetical protein B0H14DRAFT_1572916 [Mycena olivaceomarginata]|nr:hypothetical protein B0H14DRAFT_1572916 [Mycena olivaceomarginata]
MSVSYSPSHPDFVVEFKSGEFTSFLKTCRNFAQGETLTVLSNLTRSPKAYSSVQCGRGPEDNVELNSDFVFGKYLPLPKSCFPDTAQVNHSCEPNIVFDLSSADSSKWHVRALKDIEAGSPVTFFYPSTEWDMDQAFDCRCGTKSCLGRIQGAKYLTVEELLRHGTWANPWILELMESK